MKSGSRSNALLVELLIVVMFFMLTTTVLLEVFAKANSFNKRSELLTVSMVEAQNLADRLYAAEDADGLLKAEGFTEENGLWGKDEKTYRVEVTVTPIEDETGVFRRQEVRVLSNGELVYSLPCSRWEVKP